MWVNEEKFMFVIPDYQKFSLLIRGYVWTSNGSYRQEPGEYLNKSEFIVEEIEVLQLPLI